MSVKRMGGAARKKKHTQRRARSEAVELSLPTEQKEPESDIFAYLIGLYARAGVGKSTFGAAFPDAIMFSCERVSKGLRCFDFNAKNGGVTDWGTFRGGVDLLVKSPKKFKTVVIDTIEAAYDHCLAWICKRENVSHPSDANDYGKTWGAIVDEFDEQISRIWNTGRGVVLLSHSKEVEITSPSGDKYTRIQPYLSGKMFEWFKQKTDFLLYADYVRVGGASQRILITEGDDIVDAKHPGDVDMPRFLPFLKGKRGVDVLEQAFAGEDVGIPADRIFPNKKTSAAATQLVGNARMGERKPKKKKRRRSQ